MILLWLILFFSFVPSALAAPLRVSPTNSHYFQDQNTGKTIHLGGLSIGWDQQDHWFGRPVTYSNQSTLNFNNFMSFMVARKLNFYRNWIEFSTGCAQVGGNADCHGNLTTPMPFGRSGTPGALDGGNKFDLGTTGSPNWNQGFFNQLRARIIQAGTNGIYVSVMFFEPYAFDGITPDESQWSGNVFNSANNINGVDADTNKDGWGTEFWTAPSATILAYQQAFARKLVDTLYDLDNVIYEASNETGGALTWQQNMVTYIKNYETSTYGAGRTHIVTMGGGGLSGANAYSNYTEAQITGYADAGAFSIDKSWQSYLTTPPVQSHNKPAWFDMDHLNAVDNARAHVWRSLTRGYAIFTDYDLPYEFPANEDATWDNLRYNIGYANYFANTVFPDFAATTPNSSTSFCSTGYALTTSGTTNVLCYNPSAGNTIVNLPAGTYNYQWFNPATYAITAGSSTSASSGNRTFTPPFSGDSVLYLAAGPPPAPIVWNNSRTGQSGNASQVSGSWANWTADIPLLPGLNPITVTATDSSGNTGSAGIGVTYSIVSAPALVLAISCDNTVADVSGNINNGSLVGGATYAAGKYNEACSFNGTTASVDVADSTTFALPTWTLEAWIKMAATSTANRSVISKISSYWLYAASSSYCAAGAPISGAYTPGEREVCYSTPFDTNWHYYAATNDGTTLTMYIDGAAVTTATGGPAVTTSGAVQLGAYSGGDFFSGLVDNIRIYSGVRTAAEIIADRDAPVSPVSLPPPTGLKITSQFSVGAGGTAQIGVIP